MTPPAYNNNAPVNALAILLADEFVLYMKTLNAHWNVKGTDFYSAHVLFEMQYKELLQIVDDIAERILSLGYRPPATLKQFLSTARIHEHDVQQLKSKAFIELLLADHELIIQSLREHVKQFSDDIHDPVTIDMFTSLMATHEKMAWILRSHTK